VTTETKDKADAQIQDDGRITISELCVATGIGKLAAMAISENLSTEILRKVAAEIGHRRTRSSPKIHLGRTAPAQ
jgi:hypothetical protein